MKQYHAVELISEVYAGKRVLSGTTGILLERKAGGEWLVLFLNSKNEGEYAVGLARESELKVLGTISEGTKSDIKKLTARKDFLTHTAFSVRTVKEYDLVELVTDRPQYSKYGVMRGMRGAVMSDVAIMGKWGVIFSEDGAGRDIAMLEVREEDLRVVL